MYEKQRQGKGCTCNETSNNIIWYSDIFLLNKCQGAYAIERLFERGAYELHISTKSVPYSKEFSELHIYSLTILVYWKFSADLPFLFRNKPLFGPINFVRSHKYLRSIPCGTIISFILLAPSGV